MVQQPSVKRVTKPPGTMAVDEGEDEKPTKLGQLLACVTGGGLSPAALGLVVPSETAGAPITADDPDTFSACAGDSGLSPA
jgi:hypothetical protein